MKIRTTTTYIAFDGQEFKSGETCKMYEEQKRMPQLEDIKPGAKFKYKDSDEFLVLIESFPRGNWLCGGCQGDAFNLYSTPERPTDVILLQLQRFYTKVF
jgi:hypothetical protein